MASAKIDGEGQRRGQYTENPGSAGGLRGWMVAVVHRAGLRRTHIVWALYTSAVFSNVFLKKDGNCIPSLPWKSLSSPIEQMSLRPSLPQKNGPYFGEGHAVPRR